MQADEDGLVGWIGLSWIGGFEEDSRTDAKLRKRHVDHLAPERLGRFDSSGGPSFFLLVPSR